MWEDPIVAEVHRTREQLSAAFDFDVKAIFADLRRRQAGLGSRLVFPERRAEPADTAERGSAAPAVECMPEELTEAKP
jgi:hypothetical protein